MFKSLDFLEKLLNSNSPSGFEDETQKLFLNRVKDFSITKVDNHGNVIAFKNNSSKLKVMLAAHSDEVGLMITNISEKGFLFVRAIGGADKKVLPGTQVLVLSNKNVFGVIGKKAIHLEDVEEEKKTLEIEDMFVDIGATSKAEAQKKVKIGDPIVIVPNFKKLGNNLITSKALDNKVNVFIISEVIRRLKDINIGIYGVSTVQEEIGNNGIKICTKDLKVDIGIALDVCFATDCPNDEEIVDFVGNVKLGKGPVLILGAITNKKLNNFVQLVAKKTRKKIQIIAEPGETCTDADIMQKEGIATILLSIPCRYMHTPVEVCSLYDIEIAIELLVEILQRLPIDFKLQSF
jgi:putative aminopeptidase FrvX